MLSFRFALGTAPGKWLERYSSYTHWGVEHEVSTDPLGDVLRGDCLLGLVRLPDARITDELHTVYLYEEEPGVAVPRESVFAQLGEQRIQIEDLSDEIVNYRIADSGEVDIPRVREALQIVAANVGVCIAPRPLLRALSKKRITVLGLEDPTYPVTRIALVWEKQQDSEMIQDFVGIAKGRTPTSTRHSGAGAPRKALTGKRLSKSRGQASSSETPRSTKRFTGGRGGKPHKPSGSRGKAGGRRRRYGR